LNLEERILIYKFVTARDFQGIGDLPFIGTNWRFTLLKYSATEIDCMQSYSFPAVIKELQSTARYSSPSGKMKTQG
jgi:hypothetical protein